jgi:hypothetical protein
MSRKQIGLRMKDETRDQLERVRGGLSRTDYIEGAVLAQIARDLKDAPTRYTLSSFDPESQRQILAQISQLEAKKQEKRIAIIENENMPPNMAVTVPGTTDAKWLKATITTVGTVIDGIAVGWAIEGGDYPGILRLEDGSELLGGWSIPELEQIASLVNSNKFEHDFPDSEIVGGDHTVLAEKNKPLYDWPVRSSAESKSGVLPVPKKAMKGRK